jgi:hypothetical protein
MLKHSLRVGVAAATLAALSGALVGGASAAELLQNGDFSSPGASVAQYLSFGNTFVTGWTIQDEFAAYVPAGQTPDQTWIGNGSTEGSTLDGSAGPANGFDNGMVGPPGGGASVVLDGTDGFGPTGGFGFIEQTVGGLVAGHTYTLSFMQAGSTEVGVDSTQTMNFLVSVGDQTVGSSPSMNVPGEGFVAWNSFSTTFTWDGVGNVLQIAASGTGEPAFVLLADVSLTGTTGGTPEASTWAMIVAGFAGMGLLARARRRAIAVA